MWPLHDRSRPCPAAEAALPPCDALSRLGSLPSLLHAHSESALGTDHYGHLAPSCRRSLSRVSILHQVRMPAGRIPSDTHTAGAKYVFVFEVNLRSSRVQAGPQCPLQCRGTDEQHSHNCATRGLCQSQEGTRVTSIYRMPHSCIANLHVQSSPAAVEGSTYVSRPTEQSRWVPYTSGLSSLCPRRKVDPRGEG